MSRKESEPSKSKDFGTTLQHNANGLGSSGLPVLVQEVVYGCCGGEVVSNIALRGHSETQESWDQKWKKNASTGTNFQEQMAIFLFWHWGQILLMLQSTQAKTKIKFIYQDRVKVHQTKGALRSLSSSVCLVYFKNLMRDTYCCCDNHVSLCLVDFVIPSSLNLSLNPMAYLRLIVETLLAKDDLKLAKEILTA